jgi:hypothetical protein
MKTKRYAVNISEFSQWDGEFHKYVYTQEALNGSHHVSSDAYIEVFPETRDGDLWGFMPIKKGDYIEWFEGYPIGVIDKASFELMFEPVGGEDEARD